MDLRDHGVIVAGVLRRDGGLIGGRAVRGGKKMRKREQKALPISSNGHADTNGYINGNINGDVEMGNGHDDVDVEGDEEDLVTEAEEEKGESGLWVKCLAASEDGQWLGIGDLAGSISIFNLDTLRVSLVRRTGLD
jgi:hypothetical protein